MAKIWLILLICTVFRRFSGQLVSEDVDNYDEALVFCKPTTTSGKNGVRLTSLGKTRHRDVVLISTLDGRISAVDSKTGELAWSIPTEPGGLLSSSISKIEISTRGQFVRLIPSLEGNLFKFDGNYLEPLPITSDTLLSSSLKVADDVIITGGKDNRAYGIDYHTGKLRYTCSKSGCQFCGDKVDNGEVILVVRRFTNIIRAVDPLNGEEKWNYTVAHHDVTVVDRSGDVVCGKGKQELRPEFYEESTDDVLEEEKMDDLDVKFMTPQGIVRAFSSNEQNLVWQHEFGSPIANAWTVQDGLLKKLNLLDNISRPPEKLLDDGNDDNDVNTGSASLYLGVHHQQLYIQQSSLVLQKVAEAALLHSFDNGMVIPRIQWKPYLVTAVSRTPLFLANKLPDDRNLIDLPHRIDENTALIIRHDSDYPYDGGYYIFPEETPLDKNLLPNVTNVVETTVQQIIIVSLWYWWKEILGLAILTIFANILITRYFWKKLKRKAANNLQANTEERPILVRTVVVREQNQEPDDLKNGSLVPVEFSSRYYNDFDPVQCLGKGGFGVVFQAKNKIDDCEYAVKRIGLPNRDKARDKVKREVKALAKLDHVGIVRYYNAWEETPPEGWQEQKDRLLEEKGLASSNFYSTEKSSRTKSLTGVGTPLNELITDVKFMNNNHASYGFNVGLEAESGSYSFEQKDKTKCSDSSRRHQFIIKPSLYGGGDYNSFEDDINSQLDVAMVPFHDYQSKNIDASGDDSFIVFEDSGCADKSISMRKSESQDKSLTKSSSSAGRRSAVELKLETKDNQKLERSTSDMTASSKLPDMQCQKIMKTYLYIQMQLCRKETLKDWLNSNSDPRSKIQVLDFFDQIVNAVEYVHGEGLMHRDLKPSNIFFSVDGIIKIGDFGLVTTLAEGNEDHTPCDQVPSKKHTDQVGTQLYMSPEQILGLPYSHKVDIFSMGLIFFELLVPFKTQMERLQVMLNLKLPEVKFPEEFLNEQSEESLFVKTMLSHDPEARPSATEIKQHSLLQAFQPQPEVLMHRRTRTLSRTYSTSSSGSLDCI